MSNLRDGARAFQARNEDRRVQAGQAVALSLICGLGLSSVLAAQGGERSLAIKAIERSLRRERLKGLAGHWSYDLNRHIALKQVFDRLMRTGDA